jgi:hypothetical protein
MKNVSSKNCAECYYLQFLFKHFFSVNELGSEIFDIIHFRTFFKMAAKVHCESSRQLGIALSYTPPLYPQTEKTVFKVTSNGYFDFTSYPRWDSNPLSQQASGRMSYALDRVATGSASMHISFSLFFSML